MSENRKFTSAVREPIIIIGRGDQAQSLADQLSQADAGCFISYGSSQDLVSRPPAGKVAMAILAAQDSPADTSFAVRWLRNRWPRAAVTVVAAPGRSDYEQAAREGGALFFTEPLAPQQWRDLIAAAAGPQTSPAQQGGPSSLRKE